MELRGKPVADAIVARAKKNIEELGKLGKTPKLAVIRIGQKPDDLAYERGIIKRFSEAGCDHVVLELPLDCTQEDLDSTVDKANNDDSIDAILLFRPIPKNLNDDHIRNTIDPRKDIDGIGIINQSGLYKGVKDAYAPCTAQAVIEILRHYEIPMKGARVTVVGRSLVIGRPVSLLLMGENATVTICHTGTKDLTAELMKADIVVASAGRAKMIKAEQLREGQIVIDVGMNADEDGKLCGDVDYANAVDKVDSITPVPGGVGAVTTSVLLDYTVRSACKAAGYDPV